MKSPADWLNDDAGWQGVNSEGATPEQAEQTQGALLEEYEIAKLWHDVFTTGRGPELLDHLRGQLFERPVYIVRGSAVFDALEIPLSPDQWMWVRAGQNSVLHHALNEIRKAEEGPPRVLAKENDDGQ